MRLIYEKSQAEVCVGDIITTQRGELVQVEAVTLPNHPEPTGTVIVSFLREGMPFGVHHAFAPAVIFAAWEH